MSARMSFVKFWSVWHITILHCRLRGAQNGTTRICTLSGGLFKASRRYETRAGARCADRKGEAVSVIRESGKLDRIARTSAARELTVNGLHRAGRSSLRFSGSSRRYRLAAVSNRSLVPQITGSPSAITTLKKEVTLKRKATLPVSMSA